MIEEKIQLKNNILSSSRWPTAKEMSKFAANYTKTEWATLTHNFEFLSAFDHDLKEAKQAADKIIPAKKEIKLEEKKED